MDLCLVDDCDRGVRALDLCEKHYFRLRRTGSTGLERQSPSERFWDKVVKTESCWLFQGAIGYGQIKVDGKGVMAHRFAYEELVGPIPEGMYLDHLCRVPACVNPEHLEPVTPRENVLRGISAAARNAAKTHCKRGHEFTEDNTRTTAEGGRVCKSCQREQMQFLRAELPKRRSNRNMDKTHCQYGHELAGYNLMLRPNKVNSTGIERRCRTCHNRRTAESIARAKQRRLNSA